jgi:hypothetical protein
MVGFGFGIWYLVVVEKLTGFLILFFTGIIMPNRTLSKIGNKESSYFSNSNFNHYQLPLPTTTTNYQLPLQNPTQSQNRPYNVIFLCYIIGRTKHSESSMLD